MSTLYCENVCFFFAYLIMLHFSAGFAFLAMFALSASHISSFCRAFLSVWNLGEFWSKTFLPLTLPCCSPLKCMREMKAHLLPEGWDECVWLFTGFWFLATILVKGFPSLSAWSVSGVLAGEPSFEDKHLKSHLNSAVRLVPQDYDIHLEFAQFQLKISLRCFPG